MQSGYISFENQKTKTALPGQTDTIEEGDEDEDEDAAPKITTKKSFRQATNVLSSAGQVDSSRRDPA